MNILQKLFLFLLVMMFVNIFVEGWKENNYSNKFDKHIDSYISITPNNYYYKNKSQLPKIIIIDKNDKWIHHYQFDLPSEKRAGKPSDVNITKARLKLSDATRVILYRALTLMSMSAPEKM